MSINDTVVNACMNRGRGFVGVNSYTRDLRGFDITKFLSPRALESSSRAVRWLDVCCGEGRALREAASLWSTEPWANRLEIVGVDLLPAKMLTAEHPPTPVLRLVSGDVDQWLPDGSFDLVTCVHGLHYLHDKLGFLERVYSRLHVSGGILLAHLDRRNVRTWTDPKGDIWREVADKSRGQHVRMQLTNHILRMERAADGPPNLRLGFTFSDATVSESPNYSGMIAIDSWYERHTPLDGQVD